VNIEQLFKKIIIAESRPTSQEFQEEIVTRMSELSCKFTHSGIIVPHIVWLEVGSFVQALAQYDVLGIVVLSVDLSCKVKEDLQTVIRSRLERVGECYSRIEKRGYVHLLQNLSLSPFRGVEEFKEKLKEEGIWI